MVINNSPFIVGKFEKISFDEYAMTMINIWPGYTLEQLKILYDDIKLPERQTTGSAGYDFYTPIGVCFEPHKTLKIPTGIKCKIEPGWWLSLMVRSSIGTKYNIRFANTVPVIDADYYGCPANEGHIILPLVMDDYNPQGEPSETFSMPSGERVCQGIFLPYGITENDNATATRTGGFGSTNAKMSCN